MLLSTVLQGERNHEIREPPTSFETNLNSFGSIPYVMFMPSFPTTFGLFPFSGLETCQYNSLNSYRWI